MLELNAIYNMDCLIGLKQMQNESINLIITDPPYGDNEGYGRDNKTITNNEDPLLNLLILREAWRILKKDTSIYLFTNWKHYTFITTYVKEYTDFKIDGLIVWNKKQFGMGYPFRNQHEFIMVLSKGKPQYNNLGFANVQTYKTISHDETTHPHEKPKDLIYEIINNSSKENDVVLDTCVGGGNIVVACKELKRKFIGFEIDTNWFIYSSNKLKQTILEDWFK